MSHGIVIAFVFVVAGGATGVDAKEAAKSASPAAKAEGTKAPGTKAKSGAQAGARADAKPLPRVLVLATGGTIAGTSTGGAGYASGKVSADDLLAAVPEAKEVAQITADQVASVGSQDMNDDVWFKLARRIDQAFANDEADAIVVTHGTDTMEETAFFLDSVLTTKGPVVLVGSMRPSTAVSADGPLNLLEAIRVAASPDAEGRRALVVLNDRIHEARDVTKTNTTSVETFASPNSGAVGIVSANEVTFLSPPVDEVPHLALRGQAPLPRVEVVYAHSNMDPLLIDAAVAGGAKGIVVAGVGDGNMSKSAVDALAEARRKGVVVVRASRVGSGFVVPNVEVKDKELGFVAAGDLNPAKARVLTQLAIVNGITEPRHVQALFSKRPSLG